MKPRVFFDRNPFFRADELVALYSSAGKSEAAARAALDYYVRRGVLLCIKRGVYCVEGPHFEAWLLPSKLHPEAVLAYDGAAWFHDLSGLHHSLCYLTPCRSTHLRFSEVTFRGVVDRGPRDAVSRNYSLVKDYDRDGHSVSATTLERTIVDCFDRLDRAPPLEEVFETVLRPGYALDLDAVVHWALNHASAAACARVGLLLTARPERPQLRAQLAMLEQRVPRRTTYATRDREPGGMYFARWHLLVPRELAKVIPLLD